MQKEISHEGENHVLLVEEEKEKEKTMVLRPFIAQLESPTGLSQEEKPPRSHFIFSHLTWEIVQCLKNK